MQNRSQQPDKQQLAVIMKEKAKPANAQLSWAEIAKILNSTGPCIKNIHGWQKVSIRTK